MASSSSQNTFDDTFDEIFDQAFENFQIQDDQEERRKKRKKEVILKDIVKKGIIVYGTIFSVKLRRILIIYSAMF